MWRCFLLLSLITASACQGALRRAGAAAFDAAHSAMPEASERLVGPHGVRGVRAKGPIVWLVPLADGVVLVDTGMDEAGAAVREVLAGRKVLAVLLTHGHVDHVSGAPAFPQLTYYIYEADRPFLDGTKRFDAVTLALQERLVGSAARPARVVTVRDQEHVFIGGARFTCFHLPGHTPGSAGWLFRDLLFSGDAAISPDGRRVRAPYAVFSEDVRGSWHSVERLQHIDFKVLCDGHFGCIQRPKLKLRRGYGQQPLTRLSGLGDVSSQMEL